MRAREDNLQILRIYLEKLPKDDLVESIIGIVSSNANTDEALEKLTKEVVMFIQVNRIITGESKLEDFQEPHRSKLRTLVEQARQTPFPTIICKNIKLT